MPPCPRAMLCGSSSRSRKDRNGDRQPSTVTIIQSKHQTSKAMKRSVKNILLSMLGFSAAPILTACYGMPEPPEQYWDKDFKGKVTDTLGNPIEGIKVYVGEREYFYPEYTYTPIAGHNSVLTDAEGNFTIHVGVVPHRSYLVAEDVDLLENGYYHSAQEHLLDFDGTIEMTEVGSAEEEAPENATQNNE